MSKRLYVARWVDLKCVTYAEVTFNTRAEAIDYARKNAYEFVVFVVYSINSDIYDENENCMELYDADIIYRK